MKPPTKLPGPDLPSLAFEPSRAPASFADLTEHEPRGGPLDHAAIVRAAANVPAMPGAAEMSERETYRQRLIAANRALDGQVVNELGKGTLEGVAVAGLALAAVTLGPQIAVVGAIVLIGAALFGGDRQ
jgi:hypothetical protein